MSEIFRSNLTMRALHETAMENVKKFLTSRNKSDCKWATDLVLKRTCPEVRRVEVDGNSITKIEFISHLPDPVGVIEKSLPLSAIRSLSDGIDSPGGD